ncbi:monooxygenase, partial [Paracidovorax avenae]
MSLATMPAHDPAADGGDAAIAPPAPEAVARLLAEQFARTAAERDQAGGVPLHERRLLRESGLLALSV